MDLCESEASLVYRASSRTGSKAIQRNPVSISKGLRLDSHHPHKSQRILSLLLTILTFVANACIRCKVYRQANLREFEASLVYRASSRTGSKAVQRNPVLKIKSKVEMQRQPDEFRTDLGLAITHRCGEKFIFPGS